MADATREITPRKFTDLLPDATGKLPSRMVIATDPYAFWNKSYEWDLDRAMEAMEWTDFPNATAKWKGLAIVCHDMTVTDIVDSHFWGVWNTWTMLQWEFETVLTVRFRHPDGRLDHMQFGSSDAPRKAEIVLYTEEFFAKHESPAAAWKGISGAHDRPDLDEIILLGSDGARAFTPPLLQACNFAH